MTVVEGMSMNWTRNTVHMWIDNVSFGLQCSSELKMELTLI